MRSILFLSMIDDGIVLGLHQYHVIHKAVHVSACFSQSQGALGDVILIASYLHKNRAKQ